MVLLKAIKLKDALRVLSVLLTIAGVFVQSAVDDAELRDTLKEDYGLEPIEKESDE